MTRQTEETQLTPKILATIEAFKARMEREGLSYAEAAEGLGCSAARLHQTLRLSYKGDIRGLCRKMEATLETDPPEAKPAASGFVMTTVARDVIDALHLIRKEGMIGMLVGPPGVGKSAAARFYGESEGQEVVYTLAGVGATPQSLLNSLAGRLGVGMGQRATQYVLREGIAKKVAFGDYELILDDADLMAEQSLQTLRCIWDMARVGLCFIGTLAFLERLRQRRKATTNQFLSRIGYVKCLGALTDADMARLAEPYHLGDQALASVIKYAGGSARRAMLLVRAAVRIGGEKPTVKALHEALKTLLPEV